MIAENLLDSLFFLISRSSVHVCVPVCDAKMSAATIKHWSLERHKHHFDAYLMLFLLDKLTSKRVEPNIILREKKEKNYNYEIRAHFFFTE